MTHKDVPDWVDSAVARDAVYNAAHARFSFTIRALLDRTVDGEGKRAVLDAEAACHAAIAAATDTAYLLGVHGRSGPRRRPS